MEKKSAKNIKVLVIDDDPTISVIIEDMLTKADHDVERVSDPNLAVGVAKRVLPDVIILDLMMTKKPGEDVLQELKAEAELKKIPVLVFSNKGIEQDISHLEQKGAAKTLIKADTSMSELVEVVEDLAENK